MPSYTPWTWSAPHRRHYSYLLADDGTTILDTLWSGHPLGSSTSSAAEPAAGPPAHNNNSSTPRWSQSTSLSLQANAGPAQHSPPYRHYTHDSRGLRSRPDQEEHGQDDEPGDAAEEEEEEAEEEEDEGDEQRVDSPNRPRGAMHQYRPSQAYGSQQPPPLTGNRYGHNATAPAHGPGHQYSTPSYSSPPSHQFPLQRQRPTIDILPPDVQATIGYKSRRHIQAPTATQCRAVGFP